MYLYIRCVLANRATLAGYLCLLLSAILVSITARAGLISHSTVPLAFFPLVVGCTCLFLTFCGTGTMRAYRKASLDLHRNMEMERFVEQWKYREYCARCGANLALYDHHKNRPPEN